MNEKMVVNLRQPITCCKDCTDRHVACHADCERYLAEKAAYTQAKLERYQAEGTARQHSSMAKRTAIKDSKNAWRKMIR